MFLFQFIFLFFFNDTATTEIYTLSLHDALPISSRCGPQSARFVAADRGVGGYRGCSSVDHNTAPELSRSRTVSAPPSSAIDTCPKNWNSVAGDELATVGALTNTCCAPNVVSIASGGNAPACNGPETNCQNGLKSW